ncbi:MAG: hypothetical protein ACT4QE_09085 [Anaerolineales bacterium]
MPVVITRSRKPFGQFTRDKTAPNRLLKPGFQRLGSEWLQVFSPPRHKDSK